ncbi:MAG: 3-hydroxyacyl-CoA dehydrogenase NAD-binding domain-containing protein [Chloroflexota bacterium]|nr:3-hydroxyacyl-CoA dehydrogenase NAD-binding domain-containing protein [Chloroflexota bacterium]
MKYKVDHAVIIGAGTMGAAIAAHLANAGLHVTLLDIVPRELTTEEEKKGLTLTDKQVRNRIVQGGLDVGIKSRPASFFTKEHANLVSIGNLEDDFDVIGKTDWVIEVIIEDLKIKRDLMARIDQVRAPHTIVSTNTSGIPIASIAEGLSGGFRQHFLGTHFFNPPRYLKLLEIIPTEDTLPEVVEFISHFGTYRLGKGIVPAKDTPNFIGNRIFAGWISFQMDYILENGYSVPEVDAITGPPMGHPKTATFRLLDLIGLDVWAYVAKNLIPSIPHDELALRYMKSEKVTNLLNTMVENGWLGNKTKQGFYKQVRSDDGKKTFWPLDLQSLDYIEPSKPRFDSIGKAKDEDDLGKRLKLIIDAEDRAGQLVRAITYQSLAYASKRIPEIADTPEPIDNAICWGFGHEAGPFEIWDMLGVDETSQAMRDSGFPPAEWVDKMLESGTDTFYQYEHGSKVGAFNPQIGAYVPISRPPELILLKSLKDADKVVSKNLGASLIDLGDGVGCVEFHTKMNTIDEDIITMIEEALDRTDAGEFDGLVIGNQADNFSVGANIFFAVMAAKNEMWEQLDLMVKRGQDLHMRMRYFPKPVVVAPAGLALGGGAEMPMHSSRIVAASELYIGLVEFGVGLLPAWGGTKEMVRRIINPPMQTQNAEVLPFVQRVFEQIGFAKVATSAEEARQFGILGPSDRVVMNRDLLIAEAKREVLNMLASSYHAPMPEKIYAAGRDVLSALKVAVYMLREGDYVSDHDKLIAEKIGCVMCGGELSKSAWVDEQYILDLEREAFLSLAGTEKTQQRMWHTLQTGKPLRN